MRNFNIMIKLCKAILLISLFAFRFLSSDFSYLPNKKKYYVLYKNKNNKTYNTEYVKMTQQKLIEQYSKYDIAIVDRALGEKEYEYKDLQIKIIKDINFDIKFKDNIILSYDEMIANDIIIKNASLVDITALNKFLEKRNIYYRFQDINKVKFLTCESYILKNKKLVNLTEGPLFKIVDTNEKLSYLDKIIQNSSNRLVEMNDKISGEFIYGYFILNGKIIRGYNSLRHVGTIWSLILSYLRFPKNELKKVIDRAIKFFIKYYLYNGQTTDIYFLKDKKYLNIGGNGLALLVLSEYQMAFNDNKYFNIAEKLANGIIYAQKENGQIIHKYNLDYSVYKEFCISYFDGEVIFALMKFYKLTKNKIYLNSVTKAIDYFIEKKYEQYFDHWISYGLNEFFRYNHSEKYILFMTKHYNSRERTTFVPAILEELMSVYDSYEYLKSLNISSPSLNRLSRVKLLESVHFYITNLLKYYIDDEMRIYLHDEDQVMYGFYSASNNNNMRIDYIQHTLGALIHYKDLRDIKRLK